jgi:hypothetical protein
MKRITKIAPIFFGSSILLLSTMPPILAETAPSCVSLTQWKRVISGAPDRRVARATNGCKTTQRFRMIWAWAADGSCYSYPPGYEFTEERRIGFPPEPYVNELRKC